MIANDCLSATVAFISDMHEVFAVRILSIHAKYLSVCYFLG
jgi:CRISPR/Cas system CMR-associated protein Cmr5 small subunit